MSFLDTLIANVTAVTMNERMDVLFGAFIGIHDGKIVHIGKEPPKDPPKTIIDGTGMVAMPGLINCHTHLAATGLRNLFDDMPRRDALAQQLSREDKLDRRSAKASALLGMAEALRFGTTSVSDLYYYPDATAEAAKEVGMKANVALSAYRFVDENEDFDFDTDEQCRELCRLTEKWENDPLIRVDAGIYAEYTSNYRLWDSLSAYALEKNIGFQLHLAETEKESEECADRTGLTPGELLACHGIFREGTCATGCAALTPEERTLLGKKKISAVSTPMANAKMGLPLMPIPETVKSGINVALGTGSVSECGNLDMFEVMRFTALSQRLAGGDSDTMPAAAVLMMATVCGARAQGRADRCGMLKTGMDADLILLDFTKPHLTPCHNVLTALVFSAKGSDVALTMVGGNILYKNGEFPTLDLAAATEDVKGYTLDRLFDEKG